MGELQESSEIKKKLNTCIPLCSPKCRMQCADYFVDYKMNRLILYKLHLKNDSERNSVSSYGNP